MASNSGAYFLEVQLSDDQYRKMDTSEQNLTEDPHDDDISEGGGKQNKPLSPLAVVGDGQIKCGQSAGEAKNPAEVVPCIADIFPTMKN